MNQEQMTVKQERKDSILDICNGALAEEVAVQMVRIAENLADPNTDAKAARKLTIDLSFKQDERRQVTAVSFKVTPKLAASRPIEVNMTFGKNAAGVMMAAELVDNAGQVDIFGQVREKGKIITLGKAQGE